MQSKFYLLEDSPESKDMREHIYNLLISTEESNHLLAYQLIEGGGVHPDFTAPLAVQGLLAWWSYGKKGKENPAFILLRQVLPQKQITYLRTSVRRFYYWNGYLDRLATNGKISFWKELAMCVYYVSDGEEAVGVCLRYGLVESKKILERLIETSYNGYLYLGAYELQALPDGLATAVTKYIDLRNCPLTQIRRKTWTNPHVEYVDFDNTLSRLACRILAMCFPTFAKLVRTNKREADRLTTSFMKCIPAEQRDLAFYKKCAFLYKKEENYRMALKIYLYLYKTYPYPEELFMLKIAGCYALMRKMDEMLAYLTRHLAENPFYVVLEKDFWSNPEFKRYWKNREVGKLIASYKTTKNV
jgi:hypothetical protein